MLVAVVADKLQNHQAVFHYFYIISILDGFMKKAISKTEAKEQIEEFFENIKDKFPKDVKKIKKLAMSYKIPLKDKRKLFCKKCLHPHKNPKIRIKNKMKIITCEGCGYVSRWKINSS